MIAVRTLTRGGRRARVVAELAAGFILEAKRIPDLAQYALELPPET